MSFVLALVWLSNLEICQGNWQVHVHFSLSNFGQVKIIKVIEFVNENFLLFGDFGGSSIRSVELLVCVYLQQILILTASLRLSMLWKVRIQRILIVKQAHFVVFTVSSGIIIPANEHIETTYTFAA